LIRLRYLARSIALPTRPAIPLPDSAYPPPHPDLLARTIDDSE
jgi:hypothetical protein